jgi:transcriptional/translational regulatory protein YebC/TACO1
MPGQCRRAIKKATDKDTANYKEVLFEGYAPELPS